MYKKLITIFSILILLVVIITSILYYPIIGLELQVKADLKKTFILTSNGQLNGLDLEKVKEILYNDEMSLRIFDTNPINPTALFVGRLKNTSTSDIYYYRLKRNGLFSFEYTTIDQFAIRNKSFQEALSIAKQYDLTKNNPDPANITVYPAPTREEVERVKQIDDREKKLENNPAYKQGIQDCINKYSAPGTGPEQDKCFSELQSKLLN